MTAKKAIPYTDIPADKYRELFDKYIASLPKEYQHGVKWNEDGINVIIKRNNPVETFNDEIRNNDDLIIIENKPATYTKYLFNVTADPKTRRFGIATLLPQAYYGNVRNHRGILGRPAICQDNCPVWIKRYGGKVEHGHFGIHIHDNGGFFNSSLGCTVLSSAESFINEFKPLLKRIKGKTISVICIQAEKFDELMA